jgi:CelD/BcsL family acetyltransferase involved in cellulose biosynthesis
MYLTYFDPFKNLDQVRAIWEPLSEKNCVKYFLSWSWIENWIATLPEKTNLKLVVISANQAPLACFFLGGRTRFRRILVKSEGLYLNNTGRKEMDIVYPEYNGILTCDSSPLTLEQVIGKLNDRWNEIVLPLLDSDLFPAKSLQRFNSRLRIKTETIVAPYVDLQLLRDRHEDYFSLVSASTRSAIRRSLRLYQERSGIQLVEAGTLEQACEFFSELVQVYNLSCATRKWTSFDHSSYFMKFHNKLIRQRFGAGEIQLLKIVTAEETIGYLYNFIYKNTVYCYKAALHFKSDKRFKPGLVSHYLAILHNARLGRIIYDFLGHDDRYKKSLSTHERTMVSARLQKDKILFRIEEKLIAFLKSHRYIKS